MGNHQVRESNPMKNLPDPSQPLQDEGLLNVLRGDTMCTPNVPDANVYTLLQQREYQGEAAFRQRTKIHTLQRYLPTQVSGQVFMRYRHRVFCGQYSGDGETFMTASQDHRIRFYNTQKWKVTKEVLARDVGWSVISTDWSPDGKWLIYSGWSDYINLCNVVGEHEIHDSLEINTEPSHFCLFSVKFSPDSNELLGGGSDQRLYIYDLNRRERVVRMQAHDNDINSVAYGEYDNTNTIISGGDDCLCKVWDRRLMSNSLTGNTPVGIMVGHKEGIACVSSKGDGRYFISNGKDQCTKLWDIRKMDSSKKASDFSRPTADYRYAFLNQDESKQNEKIKQADASLMTYRSHLVTKTLIRCYWSPAASTGQRYIYTGSSDGVAYVYDVISGKVVAALEAHKGTVRDLSWHPYEPTLITTSWDGGVAKWTHSDQEPEPMNLGLDDDE